ncbi:hypothetical protein [Buttiauxella brennerae]|uniref:hypothetical protein n=1 Tax=Buttiauxella brennerae TaxID=82988 RepID=UPI00286F17F6|nr:hypothetical protein [Buttiauxella brennerae]
MNNACVGHEVVRHRDVPNKRVANDPECWGNNRGLPRSGDLLAGRRGRQGAGVSHLARSPLAGIYGKAELSGERNNS